MSDNSLGAFGRWNITPAMKPSSHAGAVGVLDQREVIQLAGPEEIFRRPAAPCRAISPAPLQSWPAE
jgi:hypothetical protein